MALDNCPKLRVEGITTFTGVCSLRTIRPYMSYHESLSLMANLPLLFLSSKLLCLARILNPRVEEGDAAAFILFMILSDVSCGYM